MSSVQTDACKVEQIRDGERPLACIVYSGGSPGATRFVTPNDWNQQIGFIVYGAGERIARHRHLPIERRISGTGEVLLVREGRCEVDLYDQAGTLVATRELHMGDVIIMVAGGHGFRMLEDTVLLEIKQGPYTGLAEKEYF